MTLNPENPTLLERLSPFAVALPDNVAHFDLCPFGLSVDNIVDPLRLDSAPFLDLLERLDKVTFGPEGMPMPRWVYLDGAELTGGIVGMAGPAEDATPQMRQLLSVPDDYRGPIPYSVYIAIPTYEEGVWFGHNLASVTAFVPDERLGGLGALTKAIALKVFRARQQVGATQWSSRALFVHHRMGPLLLETAWTPAHGDDETLTYRVDLDESVLRHLARDRGAEVALPEPSEWLESTDVASMKALQARIESGERLAICGRPKVQAGGLAVPLAALAR